MGLGQCNSHEKVAIRLWSLQEKYIENLLNRFNMKNTKLVGTSLAKHFKMSPTCSPLSEKNEMTTSPYVSAVESMICNGL